LPKQALLTERSQLSNTLCLLHTLACGFSGFIRAQASQATRLERAVRKEDVFEFWQVNSETAESLSILQNAKKQHVAYRYAVAFQ